MGYLKYVHQLWKKPRESMPEVYQQRLIQWRQEQSTTRISHPTRPDRAHAVGYRAKQGYIMVRQRIFRGGHRRPTYLGGRRSANTSRTMTLSKNYQAVAEDRAQRAYPNLVVLNSYWVAKDGKYFWYEVILLDPSHPVILSDPRTAWLKDRKNWQRVFHGKTAAAKRSRGLRHKGKGAEKLRPSKHAKGY